MRTLISPRMAPVAGPARPGFVRVAALLLGALVVLGMWQYGTARSTGLRGPRRPVPNGLWDKTATLPHGQYRIAIIADLDKESRVKSAKKLTFRSFWKEGVLSRDANGRWSVRWEENIDLLSQHNEAGRGMELSELVRFNGRLYTFDDRSGIAYEVAGDTNGARRVVPRWLLMEGDGERAKGQKTEWATVRDGTLYAGSFGKEYVDPKDGHVTSRGNLWVSTVDSEGRVAHEDWTRSYEQVRKVTGSTFPAYQIIETVEWSDVWQKWFVLPRRVSREPYDEVKDEKRGSNVVISCDAHFSSCTSFTAGPVTPERGFASAKFLPGSNDRILVALKSEENEAANTQNTFICVFDTDGRVLMPETPIPGGNPEDPSRGYKFEGLVFI